MAKPGDSGTDQAGRPSDSVGSAWMGREGPSSSGIMTLGAGERGSGTIGGRPSRTGGHDSTEMEAGEFVEQYGRDSRQMPGPDVRFGFSADPMRPADVVPSAGSAMAPPYCPWHAEDIFLNPVNQNGSGDVLLMCFADGYETVYRVATGRFEPRPGQPTKFQDPLSHILRVWAPPRVSSRQIRTASKKEQKTLGLRTPSSYTTTGRIPINSTRLHTGEEYMVHPPGNRLVQVGGTKRFTLQKIALTPVLHRIVKEHGQKYLVVV